MGRPPKDLSKKMASKKIARQDEIDRIPIEGKFGQGKRRFSLSRIMCKLSQTSETAIAIVFLVMNLEKLLRLALLYFFCLFMGSFYVRKKDKNSALLMKKLHKYLFVQPQLAGNLAVI